MRIGRVVVLQVSDCDYSGKMRSVTFGIAHRTYRASDSAIEMVAETKRSEYFSHIFARFYRAHLPLPLDQHHLVRSILYIWL